MSVPSPIAPPTCSDAPIWSVWLSAFHAPALAIADELGIFAILHEAPATAPELALKLDIELRATETIVGLMAALDFLVQADGRFHLTDVARHYLLPTSPYYWGGLLRRIRETPMECKRLIESLRRGRAAQEARVTGGIWDAPVPAPEPLKAFTHAMHAHSFALAMRVVPSFALSNVRRFLDVAGGSGSYSIAATLQYPELNATVLDLPVVCGVAAEYAAKLGADRVSVSPANMFVDPWPTGFERVFLSDIFHDWDDERCTWLAARAFEALAPGGKLLIHEMILSETKDAPLPAIAYSMVMIFVAQGRQRSAREIAAMLTSVGFLDIAVTMTSSGYALIAGTKPA